MRSATELDRIVRDARRQAMRADAAEQSLANPQFVVARTVALACDAVLETLATAGQRGTALYRDTIDLGATVERYVQHAGRQFEPLDEGRRVLQALAALPDDARAGVLKGVCAALPKLQVVAVDPFYFGELPMCGPPIARISVWVRDPTYASARAQADGVTMTEQVQRQSVPPRRRFWARLFG